MTTTKLSREVAQNASEIGDQPSLAREGNSKSDRGLESMRLLIALRPVEGFRNQGKLEESKPRKFQEDEELYEEKANCQK